MAAAAKGTESARGWLLRAAALAAIVAGCGDDGTVPPDPDLSTACPAETFDVDGLAPGCEPWTDCPAGTRVSVEGTATNDRECEPCVEGTFSSEANLPSCEPHRSCDLGTYRRGDGTATSDTDCESCETGTFTDTMDAEGCTPWTDCVPGELVAQEGFVTTDRECAPCPPETYSTMVNATECTPYRRCAPWLEIVEEGTATSDLTCGLWIRQFGTGEDDEVTDLVFADGELLMAGTTGGALPEETSAGGDDAFVRRMDADGNVLWTTQLGTDAADSATTLSVDGLGHVIVGGTTAGAFPGESAGGLTDAFVAQLDGATGAVRWVRQIGTAEAEAGAAAVDATGRVVVAGSTRGTLPGQSSGGGADAFVRMYDVEGGELWTAQLGTSADEILYEIVVGTGGSLFVTGELFAATSDVFVWELSPADGSVDWARELDSGADEGGYHLAPDAIGGVVAGGYTTGTFPDETPGGATDVVVWSLGADGSTRWVRQLGSIADEWADNLQVFPGGDVLVVGATPGELPGQSTFGSTDGFVHRFDGEGVDRWTRQFGTASADAVLALAHTGLGYVLIGGRTRGELPGQTELGGADAFVARLDP